MRAQEGRARTEALAQRVNERIQALQREADRLAGEARTLVGDLRRLEIERDLQAERLAQAGAAAAEAQAGLQQATSQLAQLEQQRAAQLPDLKAQLVDLYKRGRGGYARMLLEADGVRDLGRTTRAVSALVRINEQRLAEHRRTLENLRQERATVEQKAAELKAHEEEMRRARAAADRALAARTALIEQIDKRRDLNAQLAGELQVAHERLQQQVANLASGRPGEAVDVPVAAFRGALDWPAAGRVTGRFGQGSDRVGGAAVRNGIEIAAPADSPVTAVHGGTVAYADAFSGFGTLVIVDHGREVYSLYGYLASASVERGQTVEAGMELGRVGSAPAGPPALYFEIRVDGRSVDPVQWLRVR
ncbi:MAG TPA: peptidoglycan DD-metalloendopeptidase family protein [Vicinamibacterales bacterium]